MKQVEKEFNTIYCIILKYHAYLVLIQYGTIVFLVIFQYEILFFCDFGTVQPIEF